MQQIHSACLDGLPGDLLRELLGWVEGPSVPAARAVNRVWRASVDELLSLASTERFVESEIETLLGPKLGRRSRAAERVSIRVFWNRLSDRQKCVGFSEPHRALLLFGRLQSLQLLRLFPAELPVLEPVRLDLRDEEHANREMLLLAVKRLGPRRALVSAFSIMDSNGTPAPESARSWADRALVALALKLEKTKIVLLVFSPSGDLCKAEVDPRRVRLRWPEL